MARLFLPGPTDVAPDTLAAMTQPMIGHRSATFIDLFGEIQQNLRTVFQTKNRVFVTASSGTGLWEGATRNCVKEGMLACVCGAFGQRWYDAAMANGMPVEKVESEWGQPILPDQVHDALAVGSFDVLAVVHNETSTGIENPVREIVASARALQPDIVVMVDAVSSAGGVNLRPDEWDLDILITSSQKCFALPPGLAFAVVSDRAMARAHTIEHRGWYFDFLALDKYLHQHLTPATPAISLLFALKHQLAHILTEGLENRFQRHAKMAEIVRDWAEDGFALFAAPDYRSKTVTAVSNTQAIDVDALNQYLGLQGMTISNGYGKLKDATFRIGHMGEIQPEDIEQLLEQIDSFRAIKGR